jgi:hypothetical protein
MKGLKKMIFIGDLFEYINRAYFGYNAVGSILVLGGHGIKI